VRYSEVIKGAYFESSERQGTTRSTNLVDYEPTVGRING
jgi:hypothetical protein